MKKFLLFVFVILGTCIFTSTCFSKALTVTLDPGHGREAAGAAYEYSGQLVCEKTLNLKISKYLKNILEMNYTDKNGEPVKVFLTRNNDDVNPTLAERVKLAKKNGSDVLISLHNNAASNHDKNGAMVLVTAQKNYLPENATITNIYDIENNLAKCILSNLEKLGIEVYKIEANFQNFNFSNGILRRLSDDGDKYPNGEITDYYGIVKHGILANVPSIIVEHAYLDNKSDYEKFLSNDSKLKALAEADAAGIAEYYDLKKI